MINQILNKMKLRKYKDIFLVDTENVGYQIPNNIPKSALIYLFISNPTALSKFQYLDNEQIKIIDLCPLLQKQAIKNGMDFCIVTKLKELVDISHSHHIVIVSRDKGYDCAIQFIKEDHPTYQIERYPLSMENYFHVQNAFKDILKHIDLDTKYSIFKHTSMETLKRDLTKEQKEHFVIYHYKDPICGNTVFVEYDIYNHLYLLYYSGNIKSSFQYREEAFQMFLKMSQEMKKKYEKYESKEQYTKANDLKIISFIEEASLKQQSLLKCLIQHFGKDEAMNLYLNFLN